jgi:glycosyltransferase involved in cell wall biosynthesis
VNVVYDSRSALPRAGGIQEHLDRLSRTLTRRGHVVRVLAARIDDAAFTRTNTTLRAQAFRPFMSDLVRVEPYPLTARRRLRMWPVALGALRGSDPIFGYHRLRRWALPSVVRALAPAFAPIFRRADVAHAMGGEAQAYAAFTAAKALHLPFVITPFAHPGAWGDDPLNLGLYAQADAVVALLDGEARWLAENGVNAARIHTIGVAAPEPVADPRLPDLQPGPPIVLFLGRKAAYKYRLLLDALPHVRADARFVFLGPPTDEWLRDVASLREDPRVIDVPKVDERTKWGWLAAATMLCLPSVSEIMPVSILEAWQMSLPLVVAEGRWTADLVTDGRNGLVVPPEPRALARAIEEVLADTARARKLGEAGTATVQQKYAAAAVSAAHERLYGSLVGAKG